MAAIFALFFACLVHSGRITSIFFAAKTIIEPIEHQITLRFSFVLIIISAAAILELVLSLMRQTGKKKVMTMPYEMMENPSVSDAKRRSDKAVATMQEGLEGLVAKMAEKRDYR